jgi:leucyl aminopeptidase
MKNTRCSVVKNNAEKFSGDFLVFLITIDQKGNLKGSRIIQPFLENLRGLKEFKGKKETFILHYPPYETAGSNFSAKRILLIGLGKIEKKDSPGTTRELLRNIGGLIAKQCKKSHAKDVCIVLRKTGRLNLPETAEALTEGVLLGGYSFTKYKTDKKEHYSGLKKVVFFTSSPVTPIKKHIEKAETACRSTISARNMANEPGNFWTADKFAGYGRKISNRFNLKCRIYGKSELKKMKMGGILAVNQGSQDPPKLIVLEYLPKGRSDTILLVGKGLTFDSGGISLKPASGMMDMKYDMCGGAAVLSVMETVATEKPKTGVVAIVPATDNMSGAGALKPGDVITHYGGKTSEIENTDAEGRLILADALAFGIKKYRPDCVIDVATLTGAVIVALGHHHSGILGNNDTLVERLVRAGEKCGEPLWRLPLGESYTKQIKSKIADIKNTGGRDGGSITAAAYLQNFVDDVPWAHLDIAGTAWDFTEKSYIPKGPSGIAVRTLIELIRSWKNGIL